MWGLLVACVLLWAPSAFGQPTFGGGGGVNVQVGGTSIGTEPSLNFVTGASCSDNGAQSRVDCTISGGGGGSGTNGLIGIGACTPISGSTTLYMAPSTCVDTTEAAGTTKVQEAATISSMACFLSADTGSQTLTVTARTGTCGGSMSDSAFVCTMGAGASECDTAGASLVLSAGVCVSFRVSSTGALPAPRTLNCTAERSG